MVTVAVYFTVLDGSRKSFAFLAPATCVAPWVERVTPFTLDTCEGEKLG